ncbi:DUF4097 domain-containing protein [Streptomyces sp. NPDC060031]|uniref:DUF4097 family beta strand repeat-containing protein n=1 Tax=Streptomyces sp. NPDC060031 TaxID=3347043 RepID=UPI0036B0C02E
MSSLAALTASPRPARTAIAALGAGLLLAVAGCSFTDGGPKKTTEAGATIGESVTAVEVTDARAGSIEVTPGSGPGVTVRRTVHYRGDTAPAPGQRVSGGVLTFTNGCSGSCYIDYRLEVPASAAVRLDNSSGRITVTGVASADLSSDSGPVTAERITGPLKVRTSSGRITAAGLSGPSAQVHSDSGDARLDFTAAPKSVTAETGSGDVTLKVPAAPYEIAVSTTSGDREVALPSTPAAASRLSAKTTSGDLRISAAG